MIRAILITVLMCAPMVLQAQEEDAGWDGLVRLEGGSVSSAFIDPNADFSVFRRVAILQPYVAFRSNWLRDQNRSRSRNVRGSDVERIKEDVADIFLSVFVEQLEAAGYEIVNYADEDVLILRPAIIDLDITAPDAGRQGRSRVYTASAGAATLFVEAFDSYSGDLIGRAIDRRAARGSAGLAMRSNRVTNRRDARREFRVWADTLIEFLDSHYIKSDAAE
jgi:hypothetical protein